MSTSSIVAPKLLRTSASGDLLPARLAPLLAKWSAPRAKLRGQELRLARRLSLDDDACAGFVLDFAGQGARIESHARGASAPLLAWAMRELGTATKAELVDDDAPELVDDDAPERDAALAYLADYESHVEAMRDSGGERDGAAFIRWLAREELIVARPDAFEDLPLDDATRAYERLLDDDAVEDIFLSERELARLLARFRGW